METCDYYSGDRRCGRKGFREVWRTDASGSLTGWWVLCYRHFVNERKAGRLTAWSSCD